jgi:electron transport complex protein RnfB
MPVVTKAHWRLARRYGRFPFRSPVNEVLAEMLSMVFSEEEADLAAAFPARPAPASAIARARGVSAEDGARVLSALDSRGVIGSYAANGIRRYLLLPIVPGLFETVMWSGRTDPETKRFAELYERYYTRDYFSTTPKGVIKIIPVEKHIDHQGGVLPTDRVSELIESHTSFSLAACCCRHAAGLRGEPCSKPSDVCMAFGVLAEFLVDRGLARKADKSELVEAAERATEAGLVHLTDNVARANFLCSCCSCCCTALKVITSFSYPWMIAKSHFMAATDPESCEGCGKCTRRCPTGALTIADRGVSLDETRCIGCGLCVSACDRNAAVRLVERARYEAPNTSMGQLAADCGLQALGPMRLMAERFPGTYRRLRGVVEKRITRSFG